MSAENLYPRSHYLATGPFGRGEGEERRKQGSPPGKEEKTMNHVMAIKRRGRRTADAIKRIPRYEQRAMQSNLPLNLTKEDPPPPANPSQIDD